MTRLTLKSGAPAPDAAQPADPADLGRRRLLGQAAAGAAFAGAPMLLKAAPLSSRPNILFVLLDDAPRNAYGVQENAFPVISGNYLGSWLSYPAASCNSPLCAPGRAGTLSGLVSQHHGVADNHTGYNLDLGGTWMEALQRAGYRCGGYGKLINGFGVDPQPAGLPPFPYWASQTLVPPGFDDFHMLVSEPGYFGYTLNDNGVPTTHGSIDTNQPGTDYSVDVSRQQILAFIEQAPAGPKRVPWAVYWAPNAPHRDRGTVPTPPARYAARQVSLSTQPNFNAPTGPQTEMPWLQAFRPLPMTPEEIASTRNEHTQAMRALMSVNEGLKLLMDTLKARGELDSTVIVVATDNSHIYGAWGLQDKGTSFEDSLNLMLRIRYPGVASGSRPQAVSNIDLAPTLCQLAGARMRGRVDGVSFVATLKNARAKFRDAAPFGCTKDGPGNPAMDGLRFADRKLTRGAEGGSAAGQAWAHDLVSDPWELASRVPSAADLSELDRVLRSF